MPIRTVPQWGDIPAELAQELASLSEILDRDLPAKQLDRNLLIASWNLREFGRSNEAWTTESNVSPKRNRGDIYLIAEIISRFDVVALQEVQDNLSALREVMACLGPDWAFHVTDVTEGDAGAHERLAYLYDLRRVRPSGLAGELVLSPEDPSDTERLVEGLDHQLVRTPYLVSFTSSERPFVLATVHILWGDEDDQKPGEDELAPRAREAEALAKFLRRAMTPSRPELADAFRANLIVLGDFNITSETDPIYGALVDNGLQPDAGTLDSPRGPSDRAGRGAVAYDQVAWFPRSEPGGLVFDRVAGGTFAWDEHILRGEPGDLTFRISDHYPLWIEFSIRETANS